MFPPKLTKDQKEHSRQAHRSNAQVGNTWALFNMYLQMDKPPEIALEMAEKAMEVWIPWEDSRVIEYPDIDPPDFQANLQTVMRTALEEAEKAKMRRGDVAGMMQVQDISTDIEAEFATEGPSQDGSQINPRSSARSPDSQVS